LLDDFEKQRAEVIRKHLVGSVTTWSCCETADPRFGDTIIEGEGKWCLVGQCDIAVGYFSMEGID
jgi:hypothetical protein